MAKRLEYSLGLASGGFLGPLLAAHGALASFIGLAVGGGGLVSGVFNQITRGGALQDLSNRLQEPVKDLVQLQHAFTQGGVAAESVGGTLLKFQNSLSGVGEMGENTAEAFEALGLSVKELRGLSSMDALQRVFEGLNKLDRNSAAGVASTIFGRGAAGDMLQLARDAGGFADNIEKAARQGELFQRHAAAFDRLGDSLNDLKLEVSTLFAGVAADVTPALQGMFNALASGDFATLGKVLELSLITAFETSVNFFANSMARAFSALPGMLSAFHEIAVATIGNALGKRFAELSAMLIEPFNEKAAAQWARASELMDGVDAEALERAGTKIKEAFEAAKAVDIGDVLKTGTKGELDKLIQQLGANTPAGKTPDLAKSIFNSLVSSESGVRGLGALGKNNQLQQLGLWNPSASSTNELRGILTAARQTVDELKEMNATMRDRRGFYPVLTNQ